MAEWLRRQPAKLMGYARVGSNPTVVVFRFRAVIVIFIKNKGERSFWTGNTYSQNFGTGIDIEVSISCKFESRFALPHKGMKIKPPERRK
jgi:hypothetical protein